MKLIKKIVQGIGIFLVLLVFGFYITGNDHMIFTIQNTIFKRPDGPCY